MNKRTVSCNVDSKWMTASQAMKEFQMSRGVLERISGRCGAKTVDGRWVRYDARKIEAHLASIFKTL